MTGHGGAARLTFEALLAVDPESKVDTMMQTRDWVEGDLDELDYAVLDLVTDFARRHGLKLTTDPGPKGFDVAGLPPKWGPPVIHVRAEAGSDQPICGHSDAVDAVVDEAQVGDAEVDHDRLCRECLMAIRR